MELLYNGSLELVADTEINLTKPVTDFSYFDVFACAIVGNDQGQRRFSGRFNNLAVGVSTAWSDFGIFYNSSYNACVGLKAESASKLKVSEVALVGYTSVKLERIVGYR